MAVWDAWPKRFEVALGACAKHGGDPGELVIEPPATVQDLYAVESTLGRRIPESLAMVFTRFSRKFSFYWALDMDLPEPFDEIFGGGVFMDLAAMPKLDEIRQGWVKTLFSNPEDSYANIWHRVISIMEVGNGDILAIDSSQEDDGPVLYVSHEGSDLHGSRLGLNFIDFIDKWSKLGCVGADDCQIQPFVSDEVGLDPEGENGLKWRKLFGMAIVD